MNISKYLLILYIFFIAWTGVFMISGYLLIPNIILILLLIFNRKFKFLFFSEDIFLGLFILFYFISGIINWNAKTLNYYFAYTFVFFIGYFFIRGKVFNSNVNLILRTNEIAVIFVSVFLIVEFVSQVIFKIDIQNFIPRSVKADALIYIYPRCYGVAEEPTYIAHYINTLGPIAIWSFLQRNYSFKKKYIFVITLISGLILTFSGAGFISLFVAIAVSFLIKIGLEKKISKKIILFLSVLLISIYIGITSFPRIAEVIEKKISLKQENKGDRKDRWVNDLNIIKENYFFGVGPGYKSSIGKDSTVNWYLFLILESGLITIIFLSLFLLNIFLKLIKSSIDGKYYFICAFVSCFIHLFAISAFYHLYIWFLIILIQYFVFSLKYNNKIILNE